MQSAVSAGTVGSNLVRYRVTVCILQAKEFRLICITEFTVSSPENGLKGISQIIRALHSGVYMTVSLLFRAVYSQCLMGCSTVDLQYLAYYTYVNIYCVILHD